ncbi:putative membrane protein YdfJ [Streptomyces azureus]|uniref:Putative membrane protein YdfJ n=1 Tax=Streptomyces azureus TaxID=146537 RepID=A0A0K8PQX7_STRAJ|nr:putative membrane protein YdfJ [Streptomyces azureus]
MDVGAYGQRAEREVLGDLGVGPTFRGQGHHLAFADREVGEASGERGSPPARQGPLSCSPGSPSSSRWPGSPAPGGEKVTAAENKQAIEKAVTGLGDGTQVASAVDPFRGRA